MEANKYLSKLIIPTLFILFLSIQKLGFTQEFKTLKVYEDSMLHYSKKLIKARGDDQKKELNKRLQIYVEKAARHKNSIDYQFDTLNFISVLTSKDENFRIYTWTIQMQDGHYQYFGITQSYVKKSKSYRYSKLNDQTPKLRRPESKTLYPKKWLGAYYYKIIQTKSGGKTYYTLLGWKGYDKILSKKVIEIATLRSNGDVIFGYPLFNIKDYAYFKNKRARRLVFSYSARVKMFLDYDVQSIHIEKKKKNNKSHKKQRGFSAQNKDVVEAKRIKTITKPMIVLDRLEPLNIEMEGVYEFYYPETNVVDALLFENNRWNYYPDVDARNKVSEEINAKPKKPLNYDL
ncbi:MAG: hypothetical protein KAG64_02460 [Bacteroidales bacterium]|nr:hypothetical protein [Bacteroidales bacterium]